MTRDFISAALRGEPVVDIGQLSKETKRELDRLVKAGRLVKDRRYWDTLSTFTGLGRPKSCWHPPGKEPQWTDIQTYFAADPKP